MNLTTHGAIIDFKNRPVVTDLKIQANKMFIASGTGPEPTNGIEAGIWKCVNTTLF